MPQLTVHKKSANLWFRMVVPARLRAKIGKTEIKFSLGTANPPEAKIRHNRWKAEWALRFQALDREIEAEDLARAPLLVEEALTVLSYGHRRDDTVLGAMKVLSFRLVTSWGQSFYKQSEAQYAFGGRPDESFWTDPDVEIDIVPMGERQSHVAMVTTYERTADTQGMGHRRAVVALLKAQRWDLLEPEVMVVEAITETTIGKGTALYAAVAAAFLTALASHKFEAWNDGSMAAFLTKLPDNTEQPGPVPASIVQEQAPPIVAVMPVPTGKAATPLSKALEKWREMRQPAKQSDVEVSRAVARFIEFFGDKAVGAITADDIFDYRDLVQRMPANLQLKKVHSANKTLKEAIEEAVPGIRRLTPTSVKKDLGGLQAVLSVAKSERMIVINVASEIQVAGYTKVGRGLNKKRYPFTPSMMKLLFASPIFTGCAGLEGYQRKIPGDKVYQDEMYWSFLLGAFSGARLEEIGQARLADIETIDLATAYGEPWSGVRTVIYITDMGLFQSTKTDGSSRALIVHTRLIELGFLDYIESRRVAGADRLFDLEKSTADKWTKELSRRLNRYIDAIVTTDKHYTYHSGRHEFKDRAKNSGLSKESNDQITGHAPGTAGGEYGFGASIAKLSSEMDKLNTAFVDWDVLMKAAGR